MNHTFSLLFLYKLDALDAIFLLLLPFLDSDTVISRVYTTFIWPSGNHSRQYSAQYSIHPFSYLPIQPWI